MAKYTGSFKSAFAKARKELGAGKTFTWNGKSYSTNLKEETKKAAPKAKAADKGKSDKRPTASSKRPKSRAAPMANEGPRTRPTRANAGASKAPSGGKRVGERLRGTVKKVADTAKKVHEWGQSDNPFGTKPKARTKTKSTTKPSGPPRRPVSVKAEAKRQTEARKKKTAAKTEGSKTRKKIRMSKVAER